MSETLSITLLLPYRGTGGGGRAIMRFANGLNDRGHNVRIFVKNTHLSLKGRIKKNIINSVYGTHDWLDCSIVPVIDYDSLRDYSFSPDEYVIAMCSQTSFDLMELDSGSCIPVYHCHGAEIENWDQMIRAWNLPTKKISVSSRLCKAISIETGQKCYGVVPDGVDTKEYYPESSSEKSHAVGAGFRWRYSKDPANIIRIFSEVDRKIPEIRKISFGTGRKPSGLKNVEYTRYPSVDLGRQLYSSCRVWFLPSIEEGFGLPVLEAMACGCAVVATDSGGPSDLIESGKNGFLADVGNYGEITRRIIEIVENDELYEKIRNAGFKTAEFYSWERASRIMEETLIRMRADVTTL